VDINLTDNFMQVHIASRRVCMTLHCQ